MKTSTLDVSICRRCHYYEVQGRRGGHCQRLCVQVQGGWRACPLAIPAFASSLETPTGIKDWQSKPSPITVSLGEIGSTGS